MSREGQNSLNCPNFNLLSFLCSSSSQRVNAKIFEGDVVLQGDLVQPLEARPFAKNNCRYPECVRQTERIVSGRFSSARRDSKSLLLSSSPRFVM